MAASNTSWRLESFLDSLVVELDKARETLAVKAINRPLTYTVKDMSLDLQIFPSFDGDDVKFLTAQPGQVGASKISVQLASITDQQVRATSKKLSTKEDLSIDASDIDDDTKKALRKVGVTSMDDLKKIEDKNVDLEKVSPTKKLSYTDLINRIEKSRRDKTNRPKILSAATTDNNKLLVISGENLAMNAKFEPVVVINDKLAELKKYNENELHIALNNDIIKSGNNIIVVTLDPYSIFKLNLKR
jgi:hypothetical protein